MNHVFWLKQLIVLNFGGWVELLERERVDLTPMNHPRSASSTFIYSRLDLTTFRNSGGFMVMKKQKPRLCLLWKWIKSSFRVIWLGSQGKLYCWRTFTTLHHPPKLWIRMGYRKFWKSSTKFLVNIIRTHVLANASVFKLASYNYVCRFSGGNNCDWR